MKLVCIVYLLFINFQLRWSGVTKADLEGVTKTFDEMRDDLLDLFSADTIMIGHGLNHDLISMKVSTKKTWTF